MGNDSLRRYLRELAEPLDADPCWLGSLFTRLGASVDDDGSYDPWEARQALERAAVALSLPGQAIADALLAVAEMGPDRVSCLRWLRSRIAAYGLEVKGSPGARLLLEREDGARMWVQAYVALAAKANGQVGFSVSGLNDKKVPWVVLIARPWGRAFLRRRDEIFQSLRSAKSKERGVAFVTLSQGTLPDEFSKRIEELATTDQLWDLPWEGAEPDEDPGAEARCDGSVASSGTDLIEKP